MEASTLDTSGHVRRPGFAKPLGWSDLDPFERGYIEALLSKPFEKPFPLMPVYLGFSDLAPEALARIIADCARHPRDCFGGKELAGALYWRERQFSAPSTEWGGSICVPLTPYLGDDGRVYLREQA